MSRLGSKADDASAGLEAKRRELHAKGVEVTDKDGAKRKVTIAFRPHPFSAPKRGGEGVGSVACMA